MIPLDVLQRTSLDLMLFAPGLALQSAALIHEYKHRHKKGHCPVCNYNLTGNVSRRCPECGTPIAAGTEGAAAPGPAEVKSTE